MHAMIFILQGSKHLSYKNRQITLQAGEMALLTQNNYTMSEIVGGAGVYEAALVYFDDDFVFDFLQTDHIDITQNMADSVTFAHFGKDIVLQKEAEMFLYFAQSNAAQKAAILKHKIKALWLYLLGMKNLAMHRFLQAVLQNAHRRVMHILESNVEVIQSVEDMCRIAKVSKKSLYKEVQKASKTTPKAWLDNKRLERAAFLLRHTDKSVASIAAECGFCTLSWFGVRFKDKYALSPKAYKKATKNE